MNKVLRIILLLLFAAGAVFSIVMTVMAARFMEYGRFFFYMTIAVVCVVLAFITLLKLKEAQS